MASGLFWNAREGRPRALVRLVAQALLAFVLGVLPILLIAEPLTALHRRGLFLAGLPKDSYDRVINLLVGPPIAAAVVASVVVAGRVLDRRRLGELGFVRRGALPDAAFGAVLGTALAACVLATELACGWARLDRVVDVRVTEAPAALCFLFTLVKALCVGTMEEAISRGYQIPNLAEGLGGRPPGRSAWALSALASSLVFALLHATNPNASPRSSLGLFVNGLLFATAFLLSGGLALPIALHASWNLGQGALFGYPVSGDLEGASLLSFTHSGPEVFTGGAFGPEAGLIGIGAMVLGMAAIVGWSRLRRGRRLPCE